MKMPEVRRGTQRSPSISARPRPLALALAALVAALGASVHAAEINYQLELGFLHSDNLNLDEVDPVSDTAVIPRLTFDVLERGSRASLQARGELEYRQYLDNNFPDESRGGFAGQFNWAVLPERLNLVVEDYLSQEPISVGDGRSPGNLQRLNVLLGGPTFFARLGDATRFQLDLRAADSDAEVTPGYDGERYSAAAVLEHQLTSSSQASLNLVSSEAKFDDQTEVTDYTRQDGFVRYEGATREVEYEFDLGDSRLDLDTIGDTSTLLARATVQWQMTARSRLRLRARQQFADDVQDLVVRLRDPDEALVPELVDFSAVSPRVYRENFYDTDYRYNGERLGLRVRPLYRRLRFVDNPTSDRSDLAGYIRADYSFHPRMQGFVEGFWRDREFLNQLREDTDHVYGIGVDYQLTRHWGWRAEAVHNTRDSNVVGGSYDENAVLFSIMWKR